jgi:hypothetical protein
MKIMDADEAVRVTVSGGQFFQGQAGGIAGGNGNVTVRLAQTPEQVDLEIRFLRNGFNDQVGRIGRQRGDRARAFRKGRKAVRVPRQQGCIKTGTRKGPQNAPAHGPGADNEDGANHQFGGHDFSFLRPLTSWGSGRFVKRRAALEAAAFVLLYHNCGARCSAFDLFRRRVVRI